MMPPPDPASPPPSADLLHAMAAVAEATAGLVAITDSEDRIHWVNSSFTRVTGWALDEVRGRVLCALLQPPDDELAEPWPAAQPLGAAATPTATPELKLARKSGAPYWARVSVVALGDAPGQADWRLHLLTDVTERVLAEQRARETQRWLQLAGSVFGMGLWHTSVRDGVMIWDANLKHMFGLPPDAATPRFEQLLLHYVLAEDRERLARAAREIPAPGTHAEVEFRIRRLDGKLRTIVSRQASVDYDDAGRPRRMLGAVLDVTDARSTTLQLRDALRRLRLAAEASGIGAWERDLVTGVGHWDPTMFTLMGRLPADAAPTRDETLMMVHPDDRAGVSIAWQRMAAETRPVEYEYRIVRPDGTVVNIVTRAVVEHDPDGTPRRALGTAIDITALRRTERERDALAQRIRLVAEAVGLGIWEYEPDSGSSMWNERMYALYGHTRDSFRDYAWLDAVHPDDRERMRRAFEHTVTAGAPFDVEFRVMHPGGDVRWLASRGRCETGDDGRVLRVLGVNWDITDRMRVEQAALAAERTARDLLERMLLATSATGLGVWESTLQGGDLLWDAQMFRLFGRAPDDGSPARIWREAVHPEDRAPVDARLVECVRRGEKFDAEFRIVLPDGSLRWLAARGMPRDGSDGPVMLGVTWDITERRIAESALRAKETAERASAAKTEFLSRMSHELRTPLNAILGFTQLMELDARQPLTADQRERIGHIRQAGWHLLALINEVLDLSRIEAGAARIEIGPVPLVPVLQECLTLIATDAQRRQLRVALDAAPDLPPEVMADRTRLKQIVLNLLSNAVKYNRDGGRIDVVARATDDGHTTIAVRDTGHGVSAEQMDKLFQPFNRLGLESAPIEGTGIGLTIALKLAEQMGGTLEASSEPGVGSEFRLRLRHAGAPGATLAAPMASRADISGSVLCIEDNAANLGLVQEWLKLRPGVTLFHARDGAAAQVLANVCQPDLILLDMRLPDTSGPALLDRLRRQPHLEQVPCVGMSANARDADLAQARAAGIDQYLTKPLDGGAFLCCIDALLAPTAHSR